MPRYKKIHITKDLIDTAARANSSHCMIADALGEALEGSQRRSVDLQTIRYTIDDVRYVHFTPRIAQLALIAFDQGDPIEPFDFNLGSAVQRIPVTKRSAATPEERAAKSAAGKETGPKSQERMKYQRAKLVELGNKRGKQKTGGRPIPVFRPDSNLGNRRVFGLKVARP